MVPESWSDGSNMSVQGASGPSDTQGQRSLHNGGKNLHLVSAAVLGYLKPLHQKLEVEKKKEIERRCGSNPHNQLNVVYMWRY